MKLISFYHLIDQDDWPFSTVNPFEQGCAGKLKMAGIAAWQAIWGGIIGNLNFHFTNV
ncbi:hypothetical protein D3C81_2287420 [compost metagenome]